MVFAGCCILETDRALRTHVHQTRPQGVPYLRRFRGRLYRAPNQKAALEAWGAKRNLFARSAAEQIKDPNLVKAALAHPGEVLRVPRGTTAEHLAAAGTTAGTAKRGERPMDQVKAPAKPEKCRPRPRRDKLDAARALLEDKRRDLGAQESKLASQIDSLKARLAEQKRHNADALAVLEQQVEKENHQYRQALAKWER